MKSKVLALLLVCLWGNSLSSSTGEYFARSQYIDVCSSLVGELGEYTPLDPPSPLNRIVYEQHLELAKLDATLQMLELTTQNQDQALNKYLHQSLTHSLKILDATTHKLDKIPPEDLSPQLTAYLDKLDNLRLFLDDWMDIWDHKPVL